MYSSFVNLYPGGTNMPSNLSTADHRLQRAIRMCEGKQRNSALLLQLHVAGQTIHAGADAARRTEEELHLSEYWIRNSINTSMGTENPQSLRYQLSRGKRRRTSSSQYGVPAPAARTSDYSFGRTPPVPPPFSSLDHGRDTLDVYPEPPVVAPVVETSSSDSQPGETNVAFGDVTLGIVDAHVKKWVSLSESDILF